MIAWLRRFEHRYVATVWQSVSFEDGDVSTYFWVLSENGFGHRRAQMFVCGYEDRFDVANEVHVAAWLRGGPQPGNINLDEGDLPSPERGRLIVLSGGRGDAA